VENNCIGSNGKLVEGAVVSYKCSRTYYKLAGDEVLSCGPKGWNGTLPQCKLGETSDRTQSLQKMESQSIFGLGPLSLSLSHPLTLSFDHLLSFNLEHVTWLLMEMGKRLTFFKRFFDMNSARSQ
jgi:hypothetical protein